nr:hypothetical protein BaRGS_006557 [Batillaria attramentaria]
MAASLEDDDDFLANDFYALLNVGREGTVSVGINATDLFEDYGGDDDDGYYTVYRGSQTFLFPIHLSESICPTAIVYGTAIPIAAYFVVKKLIVDPFLKQQKEQELEKKREEHAEKLAKRKQEAKAATDLMKETVERNIEAEERKMGLVIIKALYGKLQASDDGELIDRECIDVTVQLQSLVKDSKLIVPEAVSKGI